MSTVRDSYQEIAATSSTVVEGRGDLDLHDIPSTSYLVKVAASRAAKILEISLAAKANQDDAKNLAIISSEVTGLAVNRFSAMVDCNDMEHETYLREDVTDLQRVLDSVQALLNKFSKTNKNFRRFWDSSEDNRNVAQARAKLSRLRKAFSKPRIVKEDFLNIDDDDDSQSEKTGFRETEKIVNVML